MSKAKTQEQFEKEVYDIFGDEYTVVGKYINSSTKIQVKHNTCGTEYPVLPSNILKGSGCPKCLGTFRKTTEEFTKEVDELTNGEYMVIGEYINANTPIMMKHTNGMCNYEFPIKPSYFFDNKTKCPQCAREKKALNKRKTHEQFCKEVYDLVGDEYHVLSEYQDAKVNLLMKHIACGNIYPVRPNGFLRGSRCPECEILKLKEKYIKPHEKFVQEVFDLVGYEYTIESKYEGALVYIQMKHNICGNIYPVSPAHFLSGCRCPSCNESKGEKMCEDVFLSKNFIRINQENYECLLLKDKNIVSYFIPQKTFETLLGVGGGLLSYDFYIPKYNLLIEIQGIQHEKPTDFKGLGESYAKKRFKYQKEHDKRKKDYALLNNYNFLEIWYYELDKIKEILELKLQELSEKMVLFN